VAKVDTKHGRVTIHTMVMARLNTLVVILIACLQVSAAEPLISSRVTLASVQVDGCSGTIISVHGKRAFGLSVAHCATVGKSVLLKFADGSTGSGKWILSDRSRDLSLFECKSRDILGHTPLGKRTGTVMALGRHGRKRIEYSSEEEVKDTTSGKKFQRSEYLMKEGVLKRGDSGGGVFALGKLCGVISHGHDDDLVYACRESDLKAFILSGEKQLGLDLSPEGWGDTDRTREIIALKNRVKELEEALDDIRSQLADVGKTGPAGRAGPAGPAGPAGRDGEDGGDGSDATVDLSPVVKRIKELEQWQKNFRATVRIRLKPRELQDGVDR
jgi:hypothetical protein